MAGPHFLSNEDLANIAVQSCKSPPHSQNRSLGDAGIFEYQGFVKDKNNDQTLTNAAALETTATLVDGDIEGVVDVMENRDRLQPITKKTRAGRCGPSGKRQREGPSGSNDPLQTPSHEDKRKQTARDKLATKLNTVKAFHDNVRHELSFISVVEETLRRQARMADGLALFKSATGK